MRLLVSIIVLVLGFGLIFGAWVFTPYQDALAQETTNTAKTPFTDGIAHEGVMGCYGSTCHSRQEATGITVRQNEILSWQDDTATTGAHYRAYRTLLNDRSKAIVARLGLGPAQKAPQCLSCHTDGIGENLRGKKFQIDDGVGCEACHGGAGEWLTSHYGQGADHKDNLSRGLYKLEDPKTRAVVCLSCHLGSQAEGQFVNHRLMAAGHPRMSFELDLFTALQNHHSEDQDYKIRKSVASGARIWAIGQAMTLKQQLRLFQNPKLNRDGMFPELVFFDCQACHREISEDPDWRPNARPNPGRPYAPGLVKFNDSAMIMLLATAREIAPELAPKLDRQIKAFHNAVSGNGGDVLSASSALVRTADDLIDRVSKTGFTKIQTLDILDEILTETLSYRYTDYVAAEQAIMAVDTLLSSMIASRQVASLDVSDMRGEIEKAYLAVDNPNAYDQDKLIRALTVLNRRLKELR